jgi:hypothetical protein
MAALQSRALHTVTGSQMFGMGGVLPASAFAQTSLNTIAAGGMFGMGAGGDELDAARMELAEVKMKRARVQDQIEDLKRGGARVLRDPTQQAAAPAVVVQRAGFGVAGVALAAAGLLFFMSKK